MSSNFVINKKVSSKKYIESLLNEPDSEDQSSEFDTSRDYSEQSTSSSYNNQEGHSGHPYGRNTGHVRQDSFKKKEGVSNSIKALQDKIKKDLDISEPDESASYRSPTMSVKSYRSAFEKSSTGYKSPSLKSPEINSNNYGTKSNNNVNNNINTTTTKQYKFRNTSNKENTLDSSILSTDLSDPNPFGNSMTKSTSTTFQKTNRSVLNSNTSSTSTTTESYSSKTPNKSFAEFDYFTPLSTNKNTESSEFKHIPIINTKKPPVPQFKVVKKNTTPITSPISSTVSSNSSVISLDSNSQAKQELKQLQIIDKEISRKIKKLKSEIKFIEDSLPPNPCVHDFQARKKLIAAKDTLEKSLEFWEKKKYENGINFSKVTRKVVYSGGEEVTTFFSGRIE